MNATAVAVLLAVAASALGFVCLVLAVRAYRRADQYRRRVAFEQRSNTVLRAALDEANLRNPNFQEWESEREPQKRGDVS